MKLKIVISWVMVVLWMAVIFAFSNMTGQVSHDASVGIIKTTVSSACNTTNKIGFTNVPEKKIDHISEQLNYPLRKTAHMMEYFILAGLVYQALKVSSVKGKYMYILIFMTCFLYSCSDEYHQLFRQRTGQFKDIIIDMFGVIVALYIIKRRFYEKKKSN